MKSIFLLSLFVVLGYGAPKSKIKTHYDQKQTGDYNIRLSLKDFQIIALLGDDTIGDIGNLDYNYDYSELTVKPVSTISITTEKPQNDTTPANASEPTTSIKPNETDLTTKTTTTTTTTTTTAKTTSQTQQIIEQTISQNPSSTTKKPEEFNATPDKIPVFLQPPRQESNINRNIYGQTISNHEESNNKQLNTNSTAAQARKCPSGHTRDKRGRCRKFRRPTFPFELARIASLAAKLSPIGQEVSLESVSVPDN